MQRPRPGETWFFVDESGDPTFYNRRGKLIVGREGCSPILILGFVETQNPQAVRRAVLDLQDEVTKDPYLQDLPSIAKTAVAFHAKDDAPEVRYLFFRLISQLDFKAQFIVARKLEGIFKARFGSNELDFYDHLVSRLFENVLHRYQQSTIYFAQRGSKSRQIPLSAAIQRAQARFRGKWGARSNTYTTLQAQNPAGEPCLSVADYMNWAVYRAFTTGNMRYFRTVEERVSLLVDLYDSERYPENWYSRRNPFDIKKATPLRLDSSSECTA
jgi:hypothetical protein